MEDQTFGSVLFYGDIIKYRKNGKEYTGTVGTAFIGAGYSISTYLAVFPNNGDEHAVCMPDNMGSIYDVSIVKRGAVYQKAIESAAKSVDMTDRMKTIKFDYQYGESAAEVFKRWAVELNKLADDYNKRVTEDGKNS